MFRRLLAAGLALVVGCFAVAEERAEPPKLETLSLDLGDGVTLELVQIPAGKFLMGSPADGEEAVIVSLRKDSWLATGDVYDETQHEVTISKPFYMGIYQVTQAQYAAVMGKNPSKFKNGEDAPRRPVECVKRNDAMGFCKKLSEKTGRNVRLPTEAEWEYACRAGTTTMFNTGDTLEQAHFGDFTGKVGERVPGMVGGRMPGFVGTLPVGTFSANKWGLFDMHGNVWEWCVDGFGVYPTGAVTDPIGPENGEFLVLRGGSWNNHHWACRSAYRSRAEPSWGDELIGFRVAMD